MGVVVDVVLRLPSLVIGIGHVPCAEDKPGHAKRKVQANRLQGLQNDEHKYHSANATGSTQRIVAGVIPFLEIGRYVGKDDGRQVQDDQVDPTRFSQHGAEIALHRRTKKIEGEHVPQEMHMVFVDEARADKPVVLTFGFYQVGIHHQPGRKFPLVERVKRYGNGNADENDSDTHRPYKLKITRNDNEFTATRAVEQPG